MRHLRPLTILLLAAGCAGDGLDGLLNPEPTTTANGKLGSVELLAVLPDRRANHCATVAAAHLVVIGGNRKLLGTNSFEDSDKVYAARINADGTLGRFAEIGAAPSALQSCTVTSDGETIYLVSAIYESDTARGRVWRTTVQGGVLMDWQEVGDWPAALTLNNSEAWIVDGKLYVNGTELPDAGNIMATASADLGASLGSWSEDPWITGFRYAAQHALIDRTIYTLGGYGNEGGPLVVYDDVSGISILEDGTLGAGFSAGTLPAPTAFGTAVSADDWLFLIGGRAAVVGADPTDRIYAATPNDDGSLGEVEEVGRLPVALSNLDAVVAGDYLYVIGGGAGDAQVNTVYGARVRF